MKNLKIFLSSIILAFILLSCKNSPLGYDGPYNYPFETVAQWNYQYLFQITNVRPIPPNNHIAVDTSALIWNISVTSEGKYQFDDGTQTFVLRENSNRFDNRYEVRTYYQSKLDALYRYAYKGGGNALPKNSANLKLQFKGMSFNNFASLINYLTGDPQVYSDSIYIESPPSLVYKYPLKVGSKWTFVDNNFMRIEKEIVQKEIIYTPAGQFEVFKIKWNYIFKESFSDDNIFVNEYLSNDGMIKRFVLFKNVALVSAPNSDVIGYADIIMDLTIKSILEN